MPVELNHTIVSARDPLASARFAAEILGLEDPGRFGPFVILQTANGVSLDYLEESGPIASQHYAFLVTESEFDKISERIAQRDVVFWALPGRNHPGEINRRDGGRGLYFEDPDGHMLEILTRPYGSGNPA
ncbi:MAG TPA: VOC family protein [Acidimicrobiia bacterium]|jgi:catechol 2,3-dioxygenase-like lactoylglutathione lyase family enzyme